MRILNTIVTNMAHARALVLPIAAVVAVKLSEISGSDSSRFYHEIQEKAFMDAATMGIERVC